MSLPKKILVSRGHGAGWSTWNSEYDSGKVLAEDLTLVQLVEAGQHIGTTTYGALVLDGITAAALYPQEETIPASHAFMLRACMVVGGKFIPYAGGVSSLGIQEVDGPYRIKEFEGSESLETPDMLHWW